MPVVQMPSSQIKPQISPDNRWLAYVSDESGRTEVCVQPLSLDGNRPSNAGRFPPAAGPIPAGTGMAASYSFWTPTTI